MIQKGSNNSKKNPILSQLKTGEVFTLIFAKNEREKGPFMLTTGIPDGNHLRGVCLSSGIFVAFLGSMEVYHHPKAYFNLGEDE